MAVAVTPVATRQTAFTTRPPSRTFIVRASSATNVNGPTVSKGRCRNASTWVSSSAAIGETCDLLNALSPNVLTSLSIPAGADPGQIAVGDDSD